VPQPELERLPYFRLYPADYLLDTIGLSVQEHGVYCLMMFNYYFAGELPPTLEGIYRICFASDNPTIQRIIDFILGKYFHLQDGRYVHFRIERELDKLQGFRRKQSEKGKLGGAGKHKNKISGGPVKKANGHDVAEQVLDYLNQRTGGHYRAVKANVALIEARIAEGATPADLCAVVDKKCAQWKRDDAMRQYLRPSTLFNREKFAQYQGEPAPKTSGPSWT
jgi:uncharacterized phage protein (TIGR02220 family)